MRGTVASARLDPLGHWAGCPGAWLWLVAGYAGCGCAACAGCAGGWQGCVLLAVLRHLAIAHRTSPVRRAGRCPRWPVPPCSAGISGTPCAARAFCAGPGGPRRYQWRKSLSGLVGPRVLGGGWYWAGLAGAGGWAFGWAHAACGGCGWDGRSPILSAHIPPCKWTGGQEISFLRLGLDAN